MKLFAHPSAFIFLLTAGVLAGCSYKPKRPPTHPVTGTVTLKGEPVDGATVVFVPVTKGVASAAGVTDEEGAYELTTFTAGDGAQAGEYRVKVTKYNVKKPTEVDRQRYLSHEQEQAIYVENTDPTPPAKNLLPAKYESDTTSGIVHTVEDGPTTLDIEID
jgi:hypothetical protein